MIEKIVQQLDILKAPVIAYWKPIPTAKDRAYIFEFNEYKSRMTEVNINTGEIYAEGVENLWFRRDVLHFCPLSPFDDEKSVQHYFNLDKQARTKSKRRDKREERGK